MELLTSIELRILGSLIEKQVSTPDYYPLTLNALINACNQKNNRDPVVNYNDMIVETGLDALRQKGYVRKVLDDGARAPKYAHAFPSMFKLDRPEVALLCEMMLRGPQTPGELRARASRLHEFKSLELVEQTLEKLMEREAGALVVKLPRQRGSREQRFMHLLGDEPLDLTESDDIFEDQEGSHPRAPHGRQPSDTGAVGLMKDGVVGGLSVVTGRMDALEQEVAGLRSELEALKQQLAAFVKQFE